MRTKKLKELHDVSIGLSLTNEMLIERTLKRLKEKDLSEEARIAEVNLLEEELKLRDNLKKGQDLYKERKAENRGYFIGVGGSLLGVLLADFGPIIVKNLRRK